MSPNTVVTAFLTSPEFVKDTLGTVVTTTDLSDNLSATSAGIETATGQYELTSSFTTGSSASTLTSVTLLLDQITAGSATVKIYSDGGLQPGSLVGTLTSPASYSATLAKTTFTSSGISLSANSTYWVVLVANSGSFGWSWTTTDTGSGTGFVGGWGDSTDSGSTWFTFDDSPTQMQVNVRSS
jgi:hypothetical protein